MSASPIPSGTDRSQSAYEMDKTRTTGATMHELMAALYPLCRSITGDGVRQTLAILRRHIPSRSTKSLRARRRLLE